MIFVKNYVTSSYDRFLDRLSSLNLFPIIPFIINIFSKLNLRNNLHFTENRFKITDFRIRFIQNYEYI